MPSFAEGLFSSYAENLGQVNKNRLELTMKSKAIEMELEKKNKEAIMENERNRIPDQDWQQLVPGLNPKYSETPVPMFQSNQAQQAFLKAQTPVAGITARNEGKKNDVSPELKTNIESMAGLQPGTLLDVQISPAEAHAWMRSISIKKPFYVTKDIEGYETLIGINPLTGQFSKKTLGMTSELAKKLRDTFSDFASASAALDAIKDISSDTITATGFFSSLAQAARIEFNNITKSNPKDVVYKKNIAAFSSLIARGLGEKGVLTEGDVRRVLNSLPSIFDTEETAKAKRQTIEEVIKRAKQRQFGSRMDPLDQLKEDLYRETGSEPPPSEGSEPKKYDFSGKSDDDLWSIVGGSGKR